jgi:hypothetical protein
MIGLRNLSHLNTQRQKDARILFKGNRYAATVYLMGYALEYALKRRICLHLRFNRGFPEFNEEFANYRSQLALFNTTIRGIQLNQLRQIKNHNLSDLLSFSGMEDLIETNHCEDWLEVKDWNPEDRYKIRRYSKSKCRRFIKSARVILNQIK